jgi:hypothetical protein
MGVSWEAVSQSVRPWLPFTALNTVWRHLDRRARTALDVGCGKGGTHGLPEREATAKGSRGRHL